MFKRILFVIFCCASFACFISLAFAEVKKGTQEIEVGLVSWGRDIDKALEQSKKQNKPVFALFQEVPGCSGCKSFGQVVLSKPEIVQAIESEFIPLLIYNNRGGEDAKLLKRFGEPSWNYQVIRFLNSDAKDVIPRKDKIWSISSVANRMSQALAKYNINTPPYLKALKK